MSDSLGNLYPEKPRPQVHQGQPDDVCDPQQEEPDDTGDDESDQ